MATKPTLKIPKSLAIAADMYYSTKEKRLTMQREVDAIKAEEELLKNHLIDSIPKSDATGIAGKLCRVSVTTKVIGQAADWDAIYAYCAKNRAKGGFALLNKALNQKTIQEIWESGKEVPGVQEFTTVNLSVNKL